MCKELSTEVQSLSKREVNFVSEFTRGIIGGFQLSVSKPKPKYTLANHNRCKQCNEPISNQRQAREEACERLTIGFGFASHWLRKWREFSDRA